MSVRLAAQTVAVRDTVTYGFAVQEAALPFSGPTDAAPITAALVDQVPADESPNIAEFAEHSILQPGEDLGEEFDHPFTLVLDALEAPFAMEAAGQNG